jgi:signal transduction histidine kinase
VGKGAGWSPVWLPGGRRKRVQNVEIELLLDVIDEIESRAAAGGAHPHWPAARVGFLPSIKALVGRFMVTTGIGVDLRAPHVPALAGDVEAALFWVVREALANLERDARATGVVITLADLDGDVELVIRDDGVGLSARQGPGARSSPHFALRAMKRCLEEIGGTLQMTRASPRGLLIRAMAPAAGRAAS